MRLDGVRVLDLSRLLPGPYGTELLSDMGAEVIKIEQPPGGEYARGDPSPMDQAIQRNKKSVALDLKDDAGREAFLRMAEGADVVFEQFRPGVVDRLGIGYEDVRERNPEVVYCSLTGYGQDGPYSQRVGHDLNYISFAGLLDMTRPDPEAAPTIPGYPIADMAGGVFSALSIVGALLTRELGNSDGEYIDVSMMEAVMSLSHAVSSEALAGGDPRPGGTTLTGDLACYDVYETADGRYVTLAALEPKFWEEFCERIGREDLIEKHMAEEEAVRESVRAELAEVFAEKTRSEWEEELGEEDVMLGLVRTPEEMLDDPQVEARGTIKEVEGMVGRIDYPAKATVGLDDPDEPVPGIGEHTEEILAEHGYTDEELRALREEGTI